MQNNAPYHDAEKNAEKKPAQKKRLDLLLMDKGFVDTRSRARGEIMAGNVFVEGIKQDKAGSLFHTEASIELRASSNPYVSRGGLKLEKALREFEIELEGKTVLDIGASTGGFTHCSLNHGAEKVYALDVGYGQLDWRLRNDDRVINMERTNARLIKKEDFPELPDLVVIDVSFISLALILPVIAAFPVQEIICLIKPQFEATQSQVGKRGVVKDPSVHEEVLKKIMHLADEQNYLVSGLTHSPLKGPKGNIEYLIYLKKIKDVAINTEINYDDISYNEINARAAAAVLAAYNDLGT